MAALLHPGVYVQEAPGGARSIEGVPTSTAIFVGDTERGPFEPTKIRGPAEYGRLFGGHARHAGSGLVKILTRFSVDLFFQNGGVAAYILRTNAAGPQPATALNTTIATRDLLFTTSPPDTFVDMIRAASGGEWGANLSAVIQHRPGNRFRISVFYRGPGATTKVLVEDWDNLTLDPAGINYVNDVLLRSDFIRWQPEDSSDPKPPITARPASDVPDDANILELHLTPTFTALMASTALAGAFPAAPPVPADTNAPGTPGFLDPILHKLDGIDDAAIIVGTSARWVNGTDANEGFPTASSNLAIKNYYDTLRSYTDTRPKQDLFLIGDIPATGNLTSEIIPFFNGLNKTNYAGIYWPHLKVADPFAAAPGIPLVVPPSGAIAGIFARTDNRRGVFKAPAGTEATVNGIVDLERSLIDGEQDDMNPIGLNAIRVMPSAGTVVWGSRTLMPSSEWRYVPVRRTAMFLRKSIYNGIQFAVFEPNDTNLWGTLRATITAFMDTQFRNGMFAGGTSREAFFVKVDAETTTPGDQAAGVVNILVGFAPLRPAEFVVVKLSQKTATSG
jgi:phage tail sheath protein FI